MDSKGQRLMRYLDEYFESRGIAPTTWADAHGVTKTNFKKWRDGATPNLDTVEQIATETGIPFVTLLLEGGWIDAAQLGRSAPTVTFPPCAIENAIERDESLDRAGKAAMLSVLAGLRGWDGRQKRKIHV
jgi:hypothetical protein